MNMIELYFRKNAESHIGEKVPLEYITDVNEEIRHAILDRKILGILKRENVVVGKKTAWTDDMRLKNTEMVIPSQKDVIL